MSNEHSKPDAQILQALLVSHQKFLAFLENRVHSREDAEEILQLAFAKPIQQENLLEGETVVAWFLQVLRNALIDHYRHKDSKKRAYKSSRWKFKAPVVVADQGRCGWKNSCCGGPATSSRNLVDHPAMNVVHICPMHPEVRQVVPGSCPKCGMVLEPEEVRFAALNLHCRFRR